MAFCTTNGTQKSGIAENRLLQSIPVTENRFELLLNIEKSADRDWVEFDNKLSSSTMRITQNTACKGNVTIEVNNYLLIALSVILTTMKFLLGNTVNVYYMEESRPVQFQSLLTV